MHKKYIADYPWSCDGCDNEEENLPHDCDVAEEVRIIDSYKNYYQAKLNQKYQKYLDWYDDISSIGMPINNSIQTFEQANWTNRDKPDWVK